nr:hypothetical protein [Pseudarthrobacter sp. W1I19]
MKVSTRLFSKASWMVVKPDFRDSEACVVSADEYFRRYGRVIAYQLSLNIQQCISPESLKPAINVDGVVAQNCMGQAAPCPPHQAPPQTVCPILSIAQSDVTVRSLCRVYELSDVARVKLAVGIAKTYPVKTGSETFPEAGT